MYEITELIKMYREIERAEIAQSRVQGFLIAYETAELHRCRKLPNPQTVIGKIISSFEDKKVSDEAMLNKFKNITKRFSGNIEGGVSSGSS